MLTARIFLCLFGARKNTAQLAKYSQVLYVKQSNKPYLLLSACISVEIIDLASTANYD